MQIHEFDVAVLGAGPAGAASALFHARSGFRVALIERREFAKAGPSWVNGLHLAAFKALQLAPPDGDEVEAADFPIVFFSADLKERLQVEASGFTNVRMRPFIDRLNREAFAAGAMGFDRMSLADVIFEGERPVELRFHRSSEQPGAPADVAIRARLFVDAAGLGGALRGRVAALELQGDDIKSDLCIAQQQNCHIGDPAAAREFLDRLGVQPGSLISILGSEGGYSTMSVQISRDLSEVGLLAGSVSDGNHLTGPQMLKKFAADHPWVGKMIHSGGGTIPLQAPLPQLTASGIAVVGAAANQVFSTHGSGVMPALQAAKMLADAVAGAPDPGDADVLWRYCCTFQRTMGALLASYNLFRKFSQKLTAEEIAKMFRYGLMNETMMIAGIRQVFPTPSLDTGFSLLTGFMRDPVFAAAVTGTLARMPAVYLHYRNFPASRDAQALASWGRRSSDLAF